MSIYFPVLQGTGRIEILQRGDGWPRVGLAVVLDSTREIRFNKWLQREEEISVSNTKNASSLGGVTGKIQDGSWEFRIFLPQEIEEDKLAGLGIEVNCFVGQEENSCEKKPIFTMEGFSQDTCFTDKAGWYKGDFHTHTQLSDGKETIEGAMEKALRQGLDFYLPTEHNVIHTQLPTQKPMVVPGMEITAIEGHCNIFGLDTVPDGFFEKENWLHGFIDPARMVDLLAESRRKGWLTSINHPFMSQWKWEIPNTPLELIDAIEIINDPTYPDSPESSRVAAEFWSTLWNDGHCIWGIGGSDSHNLEDDWYTGAAGPSIYGDPATWVHCERLAPRVLLHNVKQGHMVVCRHGAKIGIEIQANGKFYLPGDKLPFDEEGLELHCQFSIVKGKFPLFVEWIVNGNCVKTDKLTDEYSASFFEYLQDGTQYGWVRVDVRDEHSNMYGFTNPVYWGSTTPSFYTFDAIKEEMQGRKEE